MPETIGETQKELFQEFSGESVKKQERFPALSRAPKPILVSTSIEQIILAGILLILLGCLFFFLGVLRGKSLGRMVAEKPVSQVSARPVVAAKPQTPSMASSPPAPLQQQVKASATKTKTQASQAMAADLSKPYTLQLITYKKQDLAEKEVAALRRSGLYSFIIPSGEYYQVCAGQYSNKEEAKNDLRVLGAKYKGCFLRRR